MTHACDLSRLPLEEQIVVLAKTLTRGTTLQRAQAFVNVAVRLSHEQLDVAEQRHFADFLIEKAAREGARRWP